MTASPTPPTKGKSGLVSKKGVPGFLTTYTPDIGAEIVETVRQGMPLAFAAAKCRVSRHTAEGWLRQGEEKPEGTFGPFAAAVREAQAEHVEETLGHIHRAGVDDPRQWTALMTLLERIYPDYFKRPDSKHTQNINIGIVSVEKKLHELHDAGEIIYDGG